jgi:hypothetical protein
MNKSFPFGVNFILKVILESPGFQLLPHGCAMNVVYFFGGGVQ